MPSGQVLQWKLGKKKKRNKILEKTLRKNLIIKESTCLEPRALLILYLSATFAPCVMKQRMKKKAKKVKKVKGTRGSHLRRRLTTNEAFHCTVAGLKSSLCAAAPAAHQEPWLTRRRRRRREKRVG